MLLLVGGQRIIAQPSPITSPNPWFQDTATSSMRLNVGGKNSISGTFNIESDSGSVTIGTAFSDAGAVFNDETGFVPGSETAISGTMNLWLKTTTGSTAEFSVNIDDPATGTLFGPNNGKVQFDFGSGDLSGTALASLNSDGQLSYTISNGGVGSGYTDFTVEDIVLQVDTVSDSASTALLLGGVLSGFWFLKRKSA